MKLDSLDVNADPIGAAVQVREAFGNPHKDVSPEMADLNGMEPAPDL